MKNKITALALIAATALSLAPKPAQAHDRGLAIVGGFLGGLIVANAINDSRHDYSYADRGPTTVIVNDRNDRCDDFGDRYDDRSHSGYWKDVTVQVWVPGYWLVERGHHGCSYRRYVEGYYTLRTDRVWVSNDRFDRRDHDYSYGRRG